MKLPKQRWLLVAAIAVVLGFLAWLYFRDGGGRAPSSIAEAIERRPAEFPPPYRALVPPSSADPLGSLPESADSHRLVVKDGSCFFVFPIERSGLSSLDVAYSSHAELTADFGRASRTAGVVANDTGQATLRFQDLSLVSAIGFPNTNGPCDFSRDTAVEVVTSFIRAGTATLAFESKTSVTGNAGKQLDSGWNVGRQGQLLGKDIVLGAKTTRVEVKVSRASYDLTGAPEAGTAKDFPAGFDGTMGIVGYLAAERRLQLSASVQANIQDAPSSAKIPTCRFGKMFELPANEQCFFVLPPGNAAVRVIWNVEHGAQGEPTIVLHMTGYRTTFGATPAQVPARR